LKNENINLEKKLRDLIETIQLREVSDQMESVALDKTQTFLGSVSEENISHSGLIISKISNGLGKNAFGDTLSTKHNSNGFPKELQRYSLKQGSKVHEGSGKKNKFGTLEKHLSNEIDSTQKFYSNKDILPINVKSSQLSPVKSCKFVIFLRNFSIIDLCIIIFLILWSFK
jgi:hypothetical protein